MERHGNANARAKTSRWG